MLAELDALIARWSTAREILASTLPRLEAQTLPEQIANTIIELAPVVAPTSTDETSIPVDLPAEPSPVRSTVLKPRLPRQRPANTRQAGSLRTALNGVIPHGPVAISPRDLAQPVQKPEPVLADTAASTRGSLEDLMAEVARRTSAIAIAL